MDGRTNGQTGKQNMKLTINHWAEEDRPREKMMSLGAEALSNAELLAILIGSGILFCQALSYFQRSLVHRFTFAETLRILI